MQYRPLGHTDLNVSLICLGTMTWGEQNTEAEAHAQLDMALAAGVNFIDAAEMYPVPPKVGTCGLTETYIGTWLAARKNRDKVILATKVAGPAGEMTWIRGGKNHLDRKNIEAAIDGSLRRLQTDYIDLYQLHWPDRETNYFGQLGYVHNPQDQSTPLEETLAVLDDLVKAGKVRYVGLSNETPWGIMRYMELARTGKGPRMVSIQNPYSLLNRTFEVGLAEIALREQCGLLAYSPLAFGMLTGKYLNGARPANARISMFSRFSRYTNPQAEAATERYVLLAQAHGLSPAQMALAFINAQPFVTSNIIGATTLEQLQENLGSINVTLSSAVYREIEAIHTAIPNPAP
jgi:aryl-alcohol dehydrogenase-like predicted oxidoreductase